MLYTVDLHTRRVSQSAPIGALQLARLALLFFFVLLILYPVLANFASCLAAQFPVSITNGFDLPPLVIVGYPLP